MKLRAISLATALFTLVSGQVVFANDDCSDYIDLPPVPLPFTIVGSTIFLTNDYGPFPAQPECWQEGDWVPESAQGHDATYKWTAPADGEYTFSLCGGSWPHENLLLYQFTCPDEPVYPDDFICGSHEGCEASPANAVLQDIPLSAGQEVLIVVDQANPSGGWEFELRIDDTTELESHLEAIMDIFHIPGASACIVHGGEVVWDGHFGMADIEAGRAVTESTLFWVASVSKPVTSAALMQLYDDGYFELDDNINDYLPFEVVHPWHPESPITFRMLMSHVAGIDNNPSVLDPLRVYGRDSPIPSGQFLEDYLTPSGVYYDPQANFTQSAPGSTFQYSGVGTALAGYLAEYMAGSPTFEAYCQENLFEPLGMNESSFFLSGVNSDNLAVRYTSYSDSEFISRPYYGHPCYPQNMLKTSALELARFLIAMMQGGEIDGTRILESDTVDLIHTLHYPELRNYGLFWWRADDGDRWWWGHTGGGGGRAMAQMWFTPDGDVGMITLFNRAFEGTGRFSHIIWEHALDMVTNLAIEDDLEETHPDEEVPSTGTRLAVYPNPFNPQATVTFSLEQTGWAKVGVYDLTGRLVAVLADQPFTLGNHTLTWNGLNNQGRPMPSGTYIVRLETESGVEARKVMLVR